MHGLVHGPVDGHMGGCMVGGDVMIPQLKKTRYNFTIQYYFTYEFLINTYLHMDMQESKKDIQMGTKHSIIYCLRLQHN